MKKSHDIPLMMSLTLVFIPRIWLVSKHELLTEAEPEWQADQIWTKIVKIQPKTEKIRKIWDENGKH